MEKISAKQSGVLVFIYIASGLTSLNSSEAGRDTWISALLTIFFATLLYFVYSKPFLIYKNLNIFEINQVIYGSFFGKIINILIFISVLMVAVVSFSRYSVLIKTVAFSNTQIHYIGLFMLITIIFCASNGLVSLAKFCEICIFVIVFLIIFSILVSISVVDLTNIKPILENGIYDVLHGSYSIIATSFFESYALIALIFSTKNREKLINGAVIAAILFCITMCVSYLRNMMTLGYPAIETLYYPSYSALSIVSLGDFFERQEVIVTVTFLVSDILKLSVLMIFLSQNLNFLAKTNDFKKYIVALSILTYTLSNIFFQSSIHLFAFVLGYKYVLVFPFLLIPITTYLACGIKSLKQ